MKKIDYGKWNTVVKIYDPYKGSKIYINGVLVKNDKIKKE